MALLTYLSTHWTEVLALTGQHLLLSLVAVAGAVALGLPLGLAIVRWPRWRQPVLGFANVVQTVPSLALFAFLMPVLGLGARNAVLALLLYSLLPIIRNTYTGITGVDPAVREAARAMGMTPGQVLWRVELPLAADVILAGIRVAAVLCIGLTTIAAFIGAGGLGGLIQTGLRNDDTAVTLAGALPAALLALWVDAVLGMWQGWLGSRRTAPAKSATKVWAPVAASVLTAGVCLFVFVGGRSSEAIASKSTTSTPLRIGAKDFTESQLLAEILLAAARASKINAVRGEDLGGSLCHRALLEGKMDAYPEYTGTAYTALLKHEPKTQPETVLKEVTEEYAAKFKFHVSPSLGFSNGFAMLIRGAEARRLGIKTLSEAVPHAQNWTAAFGPDFIARADGWPGLSKTYGLQLKGVPKSVELNLLNRALATKQVDLIAGNETDGNIKALDLFQLEDDRHYFPPYQGVYIVRQAAMSSHPELAEVLSKLGGSLSTAAMQALNFEVDGKGRKPAEVAAGWVKENYRP